MLTHFPKQQNDVLLVAARDRATCDNRAPGACDRAIEHASVTTIRLYLSQSILFFSLLVQPTRRCHDEPTQNALDAAKLSERMSLIWNSHLSFVFVFVNLFSVFDLDSGFLLLVSCIGERAHGNV